MTRAHNQKGVSVIIACYNSSRRITKTLRALSKQQFLSPVPWEIILVDNASSDNTPAIARAIWDYINPGIELRIVTESRPGSGYARSKGTREANYSIVLFCDDDNWLSENYIQRAWNIMEKDSSIAACGGMGIPVFETAQPAWFKNYEEAFAVGSQEINRENGRILSLYGAGLAIQKHVLEQLYSSDFNPVMPGRVGKKLNASEDTELTYAFILMGYNLYCSDELTFYHYLPKERLTREYLEKLFIANGADGPVRNLYYANISNRVFHKKIKNWYVHFMLSIFRMIKYFIIPPKRGGRAIYFNWSIAYIRSLLSIKKGYSKLAERIDRIKQKTSTTTSLGLPCRPISLERENII